MRHFVDEGLENESERVVSWRAQRPGGDAERNQRIAVGQIRYAASRISIRIEVGRARERSLLAEADEVLLPGDKLAVLIQAALEVMPAGGPVEIMLDVVGTIPKQLHRRAGHFRNPRRLNHVIVHQPPAEAAAHTRHVDRDVLLVEAERLRDQLAAGLWILGRRPDFHATALRVRGAVHRLKRSVGDERIMIGGLDDACGEQRRVAVDIDLVRPAIDMERVLHGQPRQFRRCALSRARRYIRNAARNRQAIISQGTHAPPAR